MDLKKLIPHSFSFPAPRAALLCLFALVTWCLFTAIQTKKTLESVQTNATIPNKEDRVLILAPHPDDETIAVGGLIQKSVAMHLPLSIAFLTYGDNNAWSFFWENKAPVTPSAMQALGEQRRTEALAALQTLGVTPEHITFLGFPDFHTLDLFCGRWNNDAPSKSGFTNVTAVPYANARIPGDPYTPEAVLAQLKEIIVQSNPTIIAVTHPADFNPDHRALYLFLRAALWDLGRSDIKVMPYLIHYPRWPHPARFRPTMPLLPPDPWEGSSWWIAEPITLAEQTAKTVALRQHGSQYRTSAKYFRSFVRTTELFGDFFPIVLKPFSSAATHSSARTDNHSVPNQVTRFLRGSSSSSIARGKDDITVTIRFTRPIGKQTAATVYVFGQRDGTLFAQLPKLLIRFGNLGYAVYEGNRHMPDRTVRVKRSLFSVSVTIPLSALGDPQNLMLGINAHLFSASPFDLTSWRIIELPA
jgi:LmbE family N-acetylglucosaminyl deacetylase